jgi:5-methylcytosine-specific restriction endonuclease McrA
MELTRRQYGNMVGRMKRNKLPPPPFTLDEYRRDVLGVMGGKEDGPIECRYCKRIFTLAEIAVDHAKPLSRGGSAGLDNLDYPCAADNDGKGSLEVHEYLDLLRYLDGVHPLARKDILSRLKKANSLAASARRAQALAAELRKGGGNKSASKQKQEFVDELGEF